jgi:hypothetical protein
MAKEGWGREKNLFKDSRTKALQEISMK